MSVLFEVTRYVARPNHGGFHAHGCTEYLADGGVQEYFGRSFHCECGEAMRDGDPFHEQLHERTGRIVHASCEPTPPVGSDRAAYSWRQ